MIVEIIEGIALAGIFFVLLLIYDKFKFRSIKKKYDVKEDKSRPTGRQFRGTRLATTSFERGGVENPELSDVGKDSCGSREKKRDFKRRFG